MMRVAALVMVMIAGPALAQSDLSVGSHLRQTRHWDDGAHAFRPGAAQGEGQACWQVVAHDGHQVRLRHVSGIYHPFWSDTPIPPGNEDVWFDSDRFREANPDAPPLTEIGNIFETVASCHKTS